MVCQKSVKQRKECSEAEGPIPHPLIELRNGREVEGAGEARAGASIHDIPRSKLGFSPEAMAFSFRRRDSNPSTRKLRRTNARKLTDLEASLLSPTLQPIPPSSSSSSSATSGISSSSSSRKAFQLLLASSSLGTGSSRKSSENEFSTTFRITGQNSEREINQICERLGLSGGVDALGISPDAWEAGKSRTNSLDQIEFDRTLGLSNSSDQKMSSPFLNINTRNNEGEGGEEGEKGETVTKCRLGLVSASSSASDLITSVSSLGGSFFSDTSSSTPTGSIEIVDDLASVGNEWICRGPPPCAVADRERLPGYTEESMQPSPLPPSPIQTSTPLHESITSSFMDPERYISINSWRKVGKLGQGSFGTVYEALSEDGLYFAVKEVSLSVNDSKTQQCIIQLEQEIDVLSRFQHENIVQYYGSQHEPEKLYIFLELVPKGSLAALYQKYSLYDSQIRRYTRQILSGLKYLHDHNIMHRDIKCANILVDVNRRIKLADFGLARKISGLEELKSCKGTAQWMAPEVVNPRKTYSFPADIWSLGCTVLEMVTKRPPFGDVEWHHALWRLGCGEAPPIPESLPEDAKDFIRQCLRIDPEERPSCAQLMEHPFTRDAGSSGLTPLNSFS